MSTRGSENDEITADPGHMSPEEFRRNGHALVDWIACYMEEIQKYPVLSRVSPGEIRAQLPARAPQVGESFDAMLHDVDKLIMPGITHWQSPDFFAYFPANASAPAILGDLLSSGLGVQGMIWATSPACTELEAHVLDWTLELLGLPERFCSTGNGGGVIQDTASSSALCAILAARERASGLGANRTGTPSGLRVYTSNQAHSSVEKGVKIAGLGGEGLRLIEVDGNYAMRPDALAQTISEDRAAGHTPAMVSATLGTTSSHAFDPLPAIGEICRRENLWLHVDAAHAGSAAVCPEHRWMNAGLEYADSYCFNPHKWLLTNFDCDCFWVADRAALINTLSVLPEYLKNQATASGAVIDYRDWQVPLGRRFRSLKLWFVIRHYGVEGLRAHIRRHVALAEQFSGWVDAHPDFEIAAPPVLNLVCFRHLGGDALNQSLMDTLNASGTLYLTHTRLDGQLVIRMAIGAPGTLLEHIEHAWKSITTTAATIKSPV